MAPRNQPKLKSIEVRFGQHIGDKHVRKFTVAPTETDDALYERIKSSFKPHIGNNEISVFHLRNGKRINLSYHGLVHGGIYQLGLGGHRRHGAGNENNATKKTKRAVEITMKHWNILDEDQYKILPASIAPPAPLTDNDAFQGGTPQQETPLDPFLWPTRFAEALKALAFKTQGLEGSDGHAEAVQRLSSAVEERLQTPDAQEQPRFGIKHLKTQDILSVVRYYDERRFEEEKERVRFEAEKERVAEALQGVSLTAHSEGDGSSMAQASTVAGGEAEVEGETAGDPEPLMYRDLVFRPL